MEAIRTGQGPALNPGAGETVASSNLAASAQQISRSVKGLWILFAAV